MERFLFLLPRRHYKDMEKSSSSASNFKRREAVVVNSPPYPPCVLGHEVVVIHSSLYAPETLSNEASISKKHASKSTNKNILKITLSTVCMVYR